MQKRKKLTGKLFLLIISIFIVSLGVKAGSYDDYMASGSYIPGIYITREKPTGGKAYMTAKYIKRASDGAYVYCLEPLNSISFDVKYDSYTFNQASKLNISEELWKKISLIAYYGYGYNNHNEDKWYAITQFMIWKEIAPELEIYFTDTLNGKKIERFTDEIKEINNLVINHIKFPDFELQEIDMFLGESISLTDKNNVLSNYIVSSSSVIVHATGNRLNIIGDTLGTNYIMFDKLDRRFKTPAILYYHEASQKVLAVGSYDYMQLILKVNVNEEIIEEELYNLKVTKIDEDTKLVIKELGVRFKLTNIDTEESFEYETNEEGYFIASGLKKGNYLLEEIVSPIGYELAWPITIEINEELELEFGNKKTIVPEILKFEPPNTYMK